MKKKIIIMTIILFIMDILIKFLVVNNININTNIIMIDSVFYITNVNNSGAAWGMLPNQTNLLIILISCLGFGVYTLHRCVYVKISDLFKFS